MFDYLSFALVEQILKTELKKVFTLRIESS